MSLPLVDMEMNNYIIYISNYSFLYLLHII